MIALAPSDDVSPPPLAPFDEILARELERRLHRLRSTTDVEDATDSLRGVCDQIVSQFLRNV